MWRPDRALNGPRPATLDDVGDLNRVFSESFTERYRRDGLTGVHVPQLNPHVWEYALRDAEDGAMLWYDEEGELAAFNVAHRSGNEGWMGPLAVRTDRQGMGAGRTIVQAAITLLRERGVRTLGLETMPRTVDNIGFYGRLGFQPGHLTVTMTGPTSRRGVAGPWIQLGRLSPDERASVLDACRARLQRSAPGVDYTREMALTDQLRLGDTVILESGGDIHGFALYHSAPLAFGRDTDELRVLKLFAVDADAFQRLLVVLEVSAARRRQPRVAVRCQTAYGWAYRVLVARGYHVRWTDLRMTLEGAPEPTLPEGELLFSNWEI